MSFEILDIFNIITTFLLLFFAFFLFTHKKGKKLSNRILAVFLLLKAIGIIDILLLRLQKPIYSAYPQIFYSANLFSFLWGPSIYFYTKSLAYHNFSFKKKHIAHLIPFILYLFYMIIYFHVLNGKLIMHEMYYYRWELITVTSLINFIILGYLIASLHILGIYRLKIKNHFSSIEKINLSWLSIILIGFIAVWLIEFSNNSIWLATCFHITFLSYSSVIIMFILAAFIIYKGLKHSEIFSGVEEKAKYEKSTLTKSDSDSYLHKLKTYMETKKPYLDSELTINELANNLVISSRHLSQVINERLNQNFFDFINSYRIKEAKQILLDSSNNKKTILDILLDVGFNSKSVFYDAFKKHTGMTPSEFKKSNQN